MPFSAGATAVRFVYPPSPMAASRSIRAPGGDHSVSPPRYIVIAPPFALSKRKVWEERPGGRQLLQDGRLAQNYPCDLNAKAKYSRFFKPLQLQTDKARARKLTSLIPRPAIWFYPTRSAWLDCSLFFCVSTNRRFYSHKFFDIISTLCSRNIWLEFIVIENRIFKSLLRSLPTRKYERVALVALSSQIRIYVRHWLLQVEVIERVTIWLF